MSNKCFTADQCNLGLYNLSAASCSMSLGEEKYNIEIAFRAEHSTGSCSLHLGQECLSIILHLLQKEASPVRVEGVTEMWV